jgi:hypothetical protein
MAGAEIGEGVAEEVDLLRGLVVERFRLAQAFALPKAFGMVPPLWNFV